MTKEALRAEDRRRLSSLLTALASVGLGNPQLTGLLEFGLGSLTAEERHWCIGPLVIQDNAWASSLPDWLAIQARRERPSWLAREYAHEVPRGLVGPAELVSVMYPACMEAPLRGEAAELYLWAGCHATAVERGSSFEQVAGELEHGYVSWRVPRDDAVFDEAGALLRAYRVLSQEIRRSVARGSRRKIRRLHSSNFNSLEGSGLSRDRDSECEP